MNEITFWQVARRPQWIVALLLVLGLASGFAWLGKWQLERAIINGQNSANHVDDVVPLESLARPGGATTDKAAGHLISTKVIQGINSFATISNRVSDGKTGFWLVSRELTAEGNLVVVLGWAPSQEVIDATIARLSTPEGSDIHTLVAKFVPLEGRLMPAEAPEVPKATQNPQTMTAVSPAALINFWRENGWKTYSGFVISSKAPDGLTPIASTAPVSDASYNWLNIFYAIEWIVFAGFAFYVWYRLVRDRLERELEMDALARGNQE